LAQELEDVLGLDLESRLGRKREDGLANVWLDWGMFTPQGHQVTDLAFVRQGGDQPVLIYEGGLFIWPAIRIGHQRVVEGIHKLGTVNMTTLSVTPLVFAIDGFLLPEVGPL